MDLRFTQQIGRGLIRLLLLTVVTNWFVLGIYFYKFGPGNWFVLSNDREIWAHFGSFYGGLMGPFVGLLAFIGIFFTILLQIEQLKISKQQVEIQEMQRVLASISAQIDQMLAATPVYFEAKPFVIKEAAPMSLFNNIAALGTEFLNTKAGEDIPLEMRQVWADIYLNSNAVALELHSLSWALEKFQEAGGSPTMVQFYQFRYGALIAYLDAMNAIDKDSLIRKVFDVEMFKKARMHDSTSVNTDQKSGSVAA